MANLLLSDGEYSDEPGQPCVPRRGAADARRHTARRQCAPALVHGQLIAERFCIEQVAGRGDMGTVYRARDLATKQLVAIKIIAKQHTTSEERFAREALLLAQLSHPAIVRYVAHGLTAERTPFLAMEWLDGEDLTARMARSGLLVDETLALLRRVCEGLAVAHAKGSPTAISSRATCFWRTAGSRRPRCWTLASPVTTPPRARSPGPARRWARSDTWLPSRRWARPTSIRALTCSRSGA